MSLDYGGVGFEMFRGEGSAGNVEGVEMTPWQYEALCRHAIALEYGISAREIQSGYLRGSARKGQKLRHQIDLWWKSSDGFCEYTVFANAKWMKRNVKLGDVMTLVGVWRDIGAHKAMMITNSGYSSGAVRQAKEKGMALVVIRPVFDFRGLAGGPATKVLAEMERVSADRVQHLYHMGVVHRGFGAGGADWVGDGGIAGVGVGGSGVGATGIEGTGVGPTGVIEGSREADAGFLRLVENGMLGEGTVADKGMRVSEAENKMMGGGGHSRGGGGFGMRRK